VKNFPIFAKFLAILGVLGASVVAAIDEMTAGMRGLTAGAPWGRLAAHG
jgi:hypothetical protein